MGYGEFARLDLAGAAIDLDLGDDRRRRAPPAAAVGPRRRARLPIQLEGDALSHLWPLPNKLG